MYLRPSNQAYFQPSEKMCLNFRSGKIDLPAKISNLFTSGIQATFYPTTDQIEKAGELQEQIICVSLTLYLVKNVPGF